MSAVPGEIDTDRQPPMTIPLRHFLVAAAFLVCGGVAGLASLSGRLGLVHVHLFLVGWVCVTIMGAMTQFVPVWSGTDLHSRRLATAQLWLVAAGLAGFAGSLALGRLSALPVFGAVMALGFYAFVYNVGRTLAGLSGYDVTERHFALALAFFVVLAPLGVALAASFTAPLSLPVPRHRLVATHATLAVFGAVLTTVFGALYQLATMFTQTDLRGIDHRLQTAESAGYPVGVAALGAGRLLDLGWLARAGGVLVLAGVLAVAVILARRLAETRVDWTPMLSRYAVAAVAMAAWALLTLPGWLDDPTTPGRTLGAGPVHLLLLGVVGFVVLGTLYHVVPFVVWVHRYSDRIGFEPVPVVDDLYDDRLAAADFVLLSGGTAVLVAGDILPLPATAAPAAGALVTAGATVFAANLALVCRRHSPRSIPALLGLPVRRGDRADAGDH